MTSIEENKIENQAGEDEEVNAKTFTAPPELLLNEKAQSIDPGFMKG